MHYLGICAIIRDETPYIEEWVAYYAHLGVEAFYLYDNHSKIPLRDTLAKMQRMMGRSRLIVHEAPGRTIQLMTYNHCLAKYGKDCKWIAFVDADEFIAPKLRNDIPSMLEEFEGYGGLAMNWKIYGTNGHLKPPEGLQIEKYTMAVPDGYQRNEVVKVIMQPDRTDCFYHNPHTCIVKDKEHPIVTENHTPIHLWYSRPPSWRIGQINHYYFRSKHEFYKKMRGPRADILENFREPPEDNIIPEGSVPDYSAARFAPGVKAILKKAATF
ncbi:MAG: glycosyltransferase family 2 protein [Deltaproteobacteria bacterium]|nr:glycosyltransferase family 2 protein [Deltaproteobacteria bacterium]